MTELDQLKSDLSSALAREKALRTVLESMSCTCEVPLHSNGHYDYCNKQRAFEACTNVVKAHRVYTAEELKPLVDALKHVWEWSCVEDGDQFDLDAEHVFRGLERARSIGLIKEDSK
jgi:hypothetical protein